MSSIDREREQAFTVSAYRYQAGVSAWPEGSELSPSRSRFQRLSLTRLRSLLAVGAPIATAWRLGGDAFDSRVDRWRCSHAIARCSYRNCRFFPVDLRGHGRYAVVRSLCTLPLYAVEASPFPASVPSIRAAPKVASLPLALEASHGTSSAKTGSVGRYATRSSAVEFPDT